MLAQGSSAIWSLIRSSLIWICWIECTMLAFNQDGWDPKSSRWFEMQLLITGGPSGSYKERVWDKRKLCSGKPSTSKLQPSLFL
ncbi:hypothetical protein M758_8G169900 [Ceratodon purpureus]|nr:hypothetical protein M758_8G169900 [Ceratodon purpureus]